MKYEYQSNLSKIGVDEIAQIPGFGDIDLSGFETQSHWQRTNTVSATQTITGMYSLYHLNRIASLSFDKALLEEEYTGESTALKVYELYFNVLSLNYQLEATAKNVSELESSYKLASTKFEEGTTIKRDRQKVEVELDKAKYNKFVLENLAQEKIDSLKHVLGLNQNDKLEIEPSFDFLTNKIEVDEAMNVAIENNQQIKQLKIATKIADQVKKESYSSYIPDFNINTTYMNQAGNDLIPKNNFLLILSMEYEFFDWGKRILTTKEHKLRTIQAQLTYEDAIEKLKLEVKSNYNRLKEAAMLISISKKAVSLAEKNLEISMLRYKEGYEIINEVLSDQSNLAQARSDYYMALYNEQTSIAQLKQTMGILLP